jgi:uncharacterized protein (TIGR03437 family)
MVRAILFAFAAIGASGAQLTVPDSTGAAGSSLSVPITFASESSAIAGLQFDLQYDDTALAVSAIPGDAVRRSDKTLSFYDIAAGQRRFLVWGRNDSPILDGALIHLVLHLSPNARAGPCTLKIVNLLGADASAKPATVKTADGTLTVQGAAGSASRLIQEGVLNGASLLPGPVAPGEIVTLLGAALGPAVVQLPDGSATSTVLGGTSVWFDGTAAPLLYAGANQINAITPYRITGAGSTRMQVYQGGQTIAELRVPVADASPAFFTINSGGVAQAAILNQDSTLNSPLNPAEKGSIIVFFATGAGQTDPPGTDGQIAIDVLPKPLLPIAVTIGGLEAKVAYGGAAPGLVAGVFQVNCIVPADAPSGYAVPIILSAGTTASPVGSTIAIR